MLSLFLEKIAALATDEIYLFASINCDEKGKRL